MRTFFYLALMLPALMGANHCKARPLNDLYLKLSGGFIQYNKVQSANSSTYRTGQLNKARPTFEGGIGCDINEYVSAEALVHMSTLHYSKKSTLPNVGGSAVIMYSAQKIKTLAATANICVNPARSYSLVTPFLAFGCGVGYNKASDLKNSFEETWRGHSNKNFIWTAGGGVMFNGLSRNYVCEIGYKYLDLGKIKVDQNESTDLPTKAQTPKLSAHQITASVNMYL
jgi:opacity protein-like surface antigen